MSDKSLSDEFETYSMAVIFLNSIETEADKTANTMEAIEAEAEKSDLNIDDEDLEYFLAKLDVLDEDIASHEDFIEAFEKKTTPSQRQNLFETAVRDNERDDIIVRVVSAREERANSSRLNI